MTGYRALRVGGVESPCTMYDALIMYRIRIMMKMLDTHRPELVDAPSSKESWNSTVVGNRCRNIHTQSHANNTLEANDSKHPNFHNIGKSTGR